MAELPHRCHPERRMTETKHEHAYEQVQEKVRLSNYDTLTARPDGKPGSSMSGYDIIKKLKCTGEGCKAEEVIGMERHKV